MLHRRIAPRGRRRIRRWIRHWIRHTPRVLSPPSFARGGFSFVVPLVVVCLLGGGGGGLPCHAQGASAGASDGGDTFEGVHLRVGGDVVLRAGERESAVVVVRGQAVVEGTAEVVVVVDGTARLDGARVAELVVVQGDALLEGSTVVERNVHLVNARLTRGEGVRILGAVQSGDGYPFLRGMLIFGVLVALGTGVVVLGAGLAAAAVAPKTIRTVGATITDEIGPTLLGALAVWGGLPLIAVLASVTVVGLPTGAALLVLVLPAFGMLGYLIAGIRLGDDILAAVRDRDEAWHPYRAAVVGLLALMAAGWVPVLGAVVSPVATLLGSGALAVHAWRAARWPQTVSAT